MIDSHEQRDLGMQRRIPRRDFLNGVAIGVGAAYAALRVPGLVAEQAGAAANDPRVYPPARTGLRGHYPEAIERFGPVERGDYTRFPAIDVDTGEDYDLVIVGGGISGLAAAYFWRRALGDSQQILILDNHDDFGGHAKRNELTYNGRTFIGYGGTQSISTPYPYSYTAKALIADLGIDVARNREFLQRDAFEKLNLGPSTFFDKEHFGEDRLVVGTGRLPWDQFFARAPLTDAARRDLTRIYSGKNPDYLAGLTIEQKIAKLARISYQEYLLTVVKMVPDALPFFMGQGGRNNKRVDTTPALEAARRGSMGFDPRHPARLYCGTFGHGLWRSDDAGDSWERLSDLTQQQVTAIAVSPVEFGGRFGVVYAGTEPSAVFRSEDGGSTWRECPGLAALPSAPTWSFPPRPHTHHVRWIAPDAVVPRRLFVAIEAGALVRSLDGGTSWQDRVQSGPFDTHTLMTTPLAPDHLHSAAGDGYFVSHDGGASWRQPDAGLEHHYLWSLAIHPGNAETMIVSAARSPWAAHNARAAESYLYRRTHGAAWMPLHEGLPTPGGTTISTVTAAIGEPGTFYAANNHGLYRSRNQGLSWERLAIGWPDRFRTQRAAALLLQSE